MDRLNPTSEKFRQVALQNVQSWMGALKSQKDLTEDPQDALELQRQTPAETPEAPPSQKPAEPAPATAPPPPATEEDAQALAERLLQGMPEEIRSTARTMLRGQLDKKSRPSTSLSKMKAPEGLANVSEPVGYRNVLDDICEDARPLAPEFQV